MFCLQIQKCPCGKKENLSQFNGTLNTISVQTYRIKMFTFYLFKDTGYYW